MPFFPLLFQRKTVILLLEVLILFSLALVKPVNTVTAYECWQMAESCTPGGAYKKDECNYGGEYCRNYANDDPYDQCSATSGAGSGCTGLDKHLYRVTKHKFNCYKFDCTFEGYECTDKGACPTTGTAYNQCAKSSPGCVQDFDEGTLVTVTPGGGDCSNTPTGGKCIFTSHSCSKKNTDCGNGCGGTSCSTNYTCSSGTCVLQNCNSGISCSGSCTASTSDTCSTDNGTKGSCKYTTNTNEGSCTQANAPDQSCTVNACSSGYTCSSGTCCTDFQPIPSCRTSPGSVPNGQCDNTSYTANCDSSTSLCYDNGSSVRCCLQGGTCSTACGLTSYTVPNGQCSTNTCSATSPCAVSSAPTVTSSCPGGVNPQLVVTWTSAAGADKYELWRSDNGGSSILISNTIAGIITTFTDNATNDPLYTPISGTSYRYTLRSWNNTTGYSAYSPWSAALEAEACDIRAPENITTPAFYNATSLRNKCFDKSTEDSKRWDYFAIVQRDGTGGYLSGGIQVYASDNIGVISVTFKVTNTGTITTTDYPAEKIGDPSADFSRDGTNIPLEKTRWIAEMTFDSLRVGNYSIQAEVKDAADNLATSSTVNFRLADLCVRPWIQTTGGDVHSNTGINTPGGP